MRIRVVATLLALGVAGAGTAHASHDRDPFPRVPPGFAVSKYTDIGGLATSLAFGPDTRDPDQTRLYITDFSRGRVLAVDDVGGTGAPPAEFATGFRNPLGVVVAGNGTVFVSDAEAARDGPFGRRSYGRVWRVRDTDEDGVADQQEVVLKDLPNGRHNTNGLAFGPDGMLYVTNGNSTDDGVEGGEPEVTPWSGSVVRVDPRATEVSLRDLPRRNALVASGMRNLYDLAFSPFNRNELFIPTNGVDDAREGSTGGTPLDELENSDDLLYRTDVSDGRADDFGFPSCLYNHTKRGDMNPYDNPHPEVIERFGRCPKRRVVRPMHTFGLHVSADGLAFQTTDAWGDDFRNDLFVAEFGNFFGTEVVGHKVVRLQLDRRGRRVVRESEFLSGATPLDLTFDAEGSMYVGDFSGAIYKVVKVADAPRVVDVTITGFQFLPQALTIPEGTIVRWTNSEVLGLNHNVTSQAKIGADGPTPGTEMNSRDLPPGSRHRFRFDSPGTYVYTCTVDFVHTALMRGKITVVPAGS